MLTEQPQLATLSLVSAGRQDAVLQARTVRGGAAPPATAATPHAVDATARTAHPKGEATIDTFLHVRPAAYRGVVTLP